MRSPPSRSPARALHEIGDRERPRAIVIGSGRRSPAEPSRLSTVAEPLLHGGAVPVVVVPRGHATRSGPLRTIGAAVDGTPEAHDAVRHGAAIARAAHGRLRLLAVAETERDDAAARIDDAIAAAGEQAEGAVLHGEPAEALAAAAPDLDLLVAGSRSYGPLRAVLLGRTTRRLLPIATCPVMIVPRLPEPADAGMLVGGMEAVPG